MTIRQLEEQDRRRQEAIRRRMSETPAAFRYDHLSEEAIAAHARLAGVPVEVMREALSPLLDEPGAAPPVPSSPAAARRAARALRAAAQNADMLQAVALRLAREGAGAGRQAEDRRTTAKMTSVQRAAVDAADELAETERTRR